MKTLTKLLLFFTFLLFTFPVFAQKVDIFDTYGLEKSMLLFGLVNHITIDEDNVKWVATEGGLLRIEGDNAEIFNVNNSEITSNRINVVEVDDSGNKWIGTYNKGLIKMDFGGHCTTFKLTNPERGESHLITSLLIDEQGNKWIGTKEGGLWVLDQKGELTSYNPHNSLLQAYQINDLHLNDKGEKLIATDMGLYKRTKGIWDLKQNGKEITSLDIDSDKNVWLSVQTQEEHTIYKNNHLVKHKLSDDFSFQLGSIYLDRLNRLWATSNGLVKYENKKWVIYNADNSDLTVLRTTCLAMDEENDVLWIGTQANGIFTLNLKSEFEKADQLAETKNAAQIIAEKLAVEQEEAKERAANATVIFQGTKLKTGDSVAIKNIRFDPTSYELKNVESIKAIEELVDIMLTNPKMHIELAGHTDVDPKPQHKNYKRIKAQHITLSKKRVQIVVDYLLERGVEEERINAKAYGGAMPLSQSNSRQNRRVEVKILNIK
jgi:outer membrane protein OmpA-like peptidoglycan-associated protein